MSEDPIKANIDAAKRDEERTTLKQRIEARKAGEIQEIITVEGEQQEDSEEPAIDQRIDHLGILADNIKARKEGKRVSLQERIELRRMEGSEINSREYHNEEIIPEIYEYFLSRKITVNDYRDQYFRRILKKRLIRLQIYDYTEYFSYLKTHDEELKVFRDNLSINVTRFYRNRAVWDRIEKVFRERISQLEDNQTLNIWSAGCAIGCEPYTIAFVINKLKPKVAVQIHATDIKKDLLKTAKDGVFLQEHMAELTEKEKKEYFCYDGKTYTLSSPPSNVKFRQLDLVNDPYPHNLDIIFCRNVLIYIHEEAKQRIFERFVEALKPGGFLILGKSETMMYYEDKVDQYSLDDHIYRKI
ncbi:MAG: protein-glutamate O-methyltransferase CheR [Candidatus Heimdallarchaeota archaeon]|nr:protein-glutamate O-methyltransferase CheR [Candidatus Heimdallarchaeota archaeon]